MSMVPEESKARLPKLNKRPRGLRRAAETSRLTPIACKLPPDVLSHCFASYHNMYLEDVGLTRFEIYLPLLHVCRRWRVVLLNAPTLWTSITLPASPKYVLLALERSNGLALDVLANDITLRSREDAAQSEWLPILENIHRIRKLHLLSIPDVAAAKQVRAFGAPLLRELVLRSAGCALLTERDLRHFFLNILDRAPALEVLGLQVFSRKICLPVGRLSSLRTLGLSNLDSSDGCSKALPLTYVLRTLRYLPRLEKLYIGCFCSRPDDVEPSAEIELPRLVALELVFWPGTPTILKYLRFPATTTIFILAYGRLDMMTEADALLHELRELIPAFTRDSSISGLRLGPWEIDSTCMGRPDGEIFQAQICATSELEGEAAPRFVVCFSDGMLAPLIARHLFCHLPPAALEQILVWPAFGDGPEVTIDPAVVAELVRTYPNLAVLALSSPRPQWTMEVLAPLGGEPPVFKAPLALYLRSPVMHTWDCRTAGTREPCDSPYCMHHIVQMLERRHDRGYPVADVVFMDVPQIPLDDVLSMCRFVTGGIYQEDILPSQNIAYPPYGITHDMLPPARKDQNDDSLRRLA